MREGGLKGQMVGSSACCPVRLLVPPFADRLYKLAPLLSSVTYWAFTFGASLLLYFGISYFVIKTYRLLSSLFQLVMTVITLALRLVMTRFSL